MCVCVCVCQFAMKSPRYTVAEPMFADISFLTRLKGLFLLFEEVYKVMRYHVTLTNLFSAEETL